MSSDTVRHGTFPSVEGRATGRVISAFAFQHLKAAATFRHRVVALETENAGRPLGDFLQTFDPMEVAVICHRRPHSRR